MKLHSFRFWYRRVALFWVACWILWCVFISRWLIVPTAIGAGALLAFDRLLRPE